MADFEQHHAELHEARATIVAASVDTQADARALSEKLHLSYQVAYGLQAQEFAAQTGAFYSAAKEYLHATGFIINAAGQVAEAVYSTGPIGRLTAKDTLALLTGLNKQQ